MQADKEFHLGFENPAFLLVSVIGLKMELDIGQNYFQTGKFFIAHETCYVSSVVKDS